MALLNESGATFLSLNEAANFYTKFRAMSNYNYFAGGTPFFRNNPVLVSKASGILVHETEVRKMCETVNISGARSGTAIKYEVNGQKRAHICTHANAHVEGPNDLPYDLPRVKEFIRHMLNLEAWVKELRAGGYVVTVSGDLNWNDDLDQNDWHYSPEKVFERLGMLTQFDHPTWPGGGTLGSRRIDYFAYSGDDLRITGQRKIPGEHSDHAWSLVEAETL